MSELLDAFDDAGLVDRETRTFLVEALANSEAADWPDILEPFVQPIEPALKVLASVPNVLTRSLGALEADAEAPEKVTSRIAELFLQTVPGGILEALGLHTVAQCARVCRAVRAVASEGEFWRWRAVAAAARWGFSELQQPKGEATWRDAYFSLLRPRCDGVYVAECGFNRWVPVGHFADLRKNAAQLAAFGGRGGKYEWIGYRRYVRLLPPDANDGSQWAFVLQDHCPLAHAQQVLMAGVDPLTHENPIEPETTVSESAEAQASDVERITKRICVGTYTFSRDNRQIEVNYRAANGDFQILFGLSHSSPKRYSDRMEWSLYTLTRVNGEVETFNLGRLEDWQGGGLLDKNKDHFAQMKFRSSATLEHLL